MMTVTGAARIFGRLASEASAASLALPSAERTQTNRAGLLLPDVGPHLNNSYSSRICASLTASGLQPLRVLAVRNSVSRAGPSSF